MRSKEDRTRCSAAPERLRLRHRAGKLLVFLPAVLACGLYAAGPFPAWKHLSSASGDLPAPGVGKEQTSLLVLDIDNDGLNDIVVAERSAAPAVVWLRRDKKGWSQFLIEDVKAPIAAGGAFCDIDGNGYPDVVFGSAGGGSEVWWWENPGPPYDPQKPWRRRAIAAGQPGQHHDQLCGDFLGAGKPQVVSWYQGGGQLFLFPVPANPRQTEPWTAIPVAGGAEFKKAEGLAKGDIDGDGKPDIVGGGRWYKHLGGTKFAAHVIDDAQTWGRVAVGDLTNNGRLEVAMVIGDGTGRLKWYERTGDPARPGAWRGHDLLGVDVTRGHSLQIADVNRDGNLDIFCAEMAQWSRGDPVDNPHAKAWIFYGDGRGNFTRTEVATGFDFHEAKLADINGDGRLDIVNKPFIWRTPRIDIWLNEPPALSSKAKLGLDQWTYIRADGDRAPSTGRGRGDFGIGFGDLTGDSRLDIASGPYFYRNPGGDMTKAPWPRVALPTDPETGKGLDAGLLFSVTGAGPTRDILAQALPNIVWLQAKDPRGESWSAKVVARMLPTRHGNGRTVKLARIVPGSKRPDIVLSGGDGTYLLRIPENPGAGDWPIMKITHSENDEQKGIGIGDIDGDGHLDVAVGAGARLPQVDWWRNPGDGSANWVRHRIGSTATHAKMVELADVNGDGRLDIVVTDSEGEDSFIFWFEAPADPVKGKWVRREVGRGYNGLDSLSVGDVNGDGLPDIVVGETKDRLRLAIYENVNGGGSWNRHQIDEGKESHKGALAVDLDGDGDLDIVSIAYFGFRDLHVWRNDNAK